MYNKVTMYNNVKQENDGMTTYSNEIMNQFKSVKNSKNQWVVELAPNKFLHWIESTDNSPVTVSRSDMAMQSWPFKEMADATIVYLKKLWSEDRLIRESLKKHESIEVECEISNDLILKKE